MQGERDARYISTDFTVRDYDYLPDAGESLLLDGTLADAPAEPLIRTEDSGSALPSPVLNFITSPSGKIYRLEVIRVLPELVRMKLSASPNQVLFDRYFAEGDRRILSLDQVNTVIEVEGIGTNNNVNITLRR